jgi:cation:H+ antiporter
MTAGGIVLGLGMLAFGGDFLIRGAVSLARALRLSPLLIGLTVVAFGTSAPELIASIRAAQLGAPGIAVGNVMGSNIANILLILGAAALITPLKADMKGFRRDATALTISAIFFALAVLLGEAGRPWGFTALAGLGIYIYIAYRTGREYGEGGVIEAEARFAQRNFGLNLATLQDLSVIAAGLLILGFGGDLLVRSCADAARSLGFSETFIGLTIVALGTSAPELVVSLLAALKRETDVAVGNIIGSNIFNVLAVLGITGLLVPVPVNAGLAGYDIWVMLGATALLVLVAASGHRISRREGAFLLVAYAVYLGVKLWLVL